MGGELGGEWIHGYIWRSLFAVHLNYHNIVNWLYPNIEDFPIAQTVKNLPVRQETRVRSLGWEVPLEKGMVIHSSILAWRIPGIEKSGGLQSVGSQRVRHNWATNTHTHIITTQLRHLQFLSLRNGDTTEDIRRCYTMFSCVQLFVTPWTVAGQAPLSLGFPRQEYWGGLPFPSPGDQGIFPTQGSNPCLLHWHMGSLLLG